MKRKPVDARRTLRMREDFLRWLRGKNAARQQVVAQPPAPNDLPDPLAGIAPPDDSGGDA